MPAFKHLSDIEHGLLQALNRGATNKQIANASGKSEKTVRNQLWALFKKIGVPNRGNAANWYRDHCLAQAALAAKPEQAAPTVQVVVNRTSVLLSLPHQTVENTSLDILNRYRSIGDMSK